MTDLKNWKLHLPIDAKGGKTGAAWQITDLIGFSHPPYFVPNADGSITFSAPVDGAKTSSNTKYPRSELREMIKGKEAAWTLATGGVMTVVTQVDRVPTLKDGKPGHVVIGQIHGKNDELVRMYREGDGTINFHCDKTGSGKKEKVYQPVSVGGKVPKVALGEKFDFRIEAKANFVTVTVNAGGETFAVTFKPISVWSKDQFYFKAGIYLGVNATQGTGDGQVTLWDVAVSH